MARTELTYRYVSHRDTSEIREPYPGLRQVTRGRIFMTVVRTEATTRGWWFWKKTTVTEEEVEIFKDPYETRWSNLQGGWEYDWERSSTFHDMLKGVEARQQYEALLDAEIDADNKKLEPARLEPSQNPYTEMLAKVITMRKAK
jgi:hypothetical protein